MKRAKNPSHHLITLYWKSSTLIALIVIIFVAAHPHPYWDNLSFAFQDVLAPLGLDVALTPVTADMMLMRDLATGISVYEHPISVIIGQSTDSSSPMYISTDQLDFHRFRIPVLLMLELYANDAPIKPHQYAICRYLRRNFREVEWFMIRASLDTKFAQRMGLNTEFSCLEAL